MPMYEYRCKKCGEVFEALQKFSDKPLSRCKFCQGKVERLISSSSFQLKGSGWYLTDYARKSSSGASEAKESTPKSSDSKSSDSKTSDSKSSDSKSSDSKSSDSKSSDSKTPSGTSTTAPPKSDTA